MRNIIKFLIPLFLFVACNQQNEQKSTNTFAQKVTEAKGYIVPQDSVILPVVIPVDESKLLKIPVGKPAVIATNTNVHIAGEPNVIIVGTPRIIIPGTDTFPLPNTILINQSSIKTVTAGIPEIIIAKDAYIKENNSQNFSSFSKLQGLKHDAIRCMLQDKSGNLWFGTDGGVSKYDGKSFTNFTEKEGLSNNIVLSIFQDKSENLWLGTTGGVSRYDGKSFTNFTENDGLSNNIVLSILQDISGNLWFGTTGGVSRYNGKSFTNFTEKEGLPSNIVLSILQDKSGNLWFGTDGGGVSKYDGNRVEAIEEAIKKGETIPQRAQQDLKKINGKLVKSFTIFTENEGLSNNIVRTILQDQCGNLWFGTDGGGVSKYDGQSFTNFTEKEGLSNNYVWAILQDQSGNLWFGTDGGGISKYDGQSFTNFTEKEGLSNNYVWSILQDQSENLWFGTSGGGVSKYDGKSFTNFTENEGLSNNIVLSILQDQSGNLWFGTSGGVSKYDGKSFTNFTKKEGLSNNIILSILQDQSGNFWFGTDGGGVSKYNGKFFTNFTEKEGLSNNIVRSVLQDKCGNLWFGTDRGVSKYDGQSFTNFTEEEGLSNNIVLSILQDKSGNLWFGTDGGGVSKLALNKAKGHDTYTFTNFTEKEGLPSNIVLSILQDKSGNLWFSTSGGGVSKYDGNRVEAIEEAIKKGETIPQRAQQDLKKINGKLVKSFTNFTEKEGLTNNYVFSMFQDKSENLWFGTRFGLCNLAKSKMAKLLEISALKGVEMYEKRKDFFEYKENIFFKSYGYENGFLGIGVNGGKTICEAKDGTIWIGSNDRLIAYHPEGDVPDTIPPNVQLTSIELFNENIFWVNLEKKGIWQNGNNENNVAADTSFVLGNGVSVGNFEFAGLTRWYNLPERLSLAYNNNYLTFNFIGITQKQNKKVKYQYKLEGIDENWSAISNRTEAPYGNLPPGSYTFKVKAMNSEGYWSKEFYYEFTIRPPWWQTWWFRTILVLCSLLIVYGYIKWRERKLKADKLLLEKKVREQTYELSEKNEELNLQNEEITSQKEHIEEIHKDLTDSINYAERIQRSFLATKEILNENLNEYFVFFKPKDVVSGDFYWASKLSNGSFALATADSTGHGVPGAIMSILNISSLEKAVEQNLCEPSEILNNTRKTIIERLKKDGSPEGGKDGMDTSLICFDFANNQFTYSSANNPVWIIRENKLIELNPDKMPVGKHDKDQIPFTQNDFQLQKEDLIYTLTDGFPDQFGGPKGKKFKYAQLKDLLISIHSKTITEQKQILEETLQKWKGDLEQVDDITILGIRI